MSESGKTPKEVAGYVKEHANAEVYKHGDAACIVKLYGHLQTDIINDVRDMGMTVGSISHYEDNTEIRFNAY